MKFLTGSRQGSESEGNGGKPGPADGARPGFALALLNRLGTPPAPATPPAGRSVLVQPPAKATLAPPRQEPQRIEVEFRCAVKDAPFWVGFERVSETYLVRHTRTAVAPGGGSASPAAQLPMEKISLAGFGCPHCKGSGQFKVILCSACGRLMCDGRVKPKGDWFLFRCCKSCGNADEISRTSFIKEVSGNEVPPVRAAPAAPPAHALVPGPSPGASGTPPARR